jgi:peptidoglycan hydrolase-like protein with peptidoglycan-binding domain
MGQRMVSLAGSVVLVAIVASIAYWAGTNAVLPPELPMEEQKATTYAVATGTVERSINLQVTAAWSTRRTVLAGADGTITGVPHEAGAVAAAGDVIATIDLEPVVVAEGAVPMFRLLERGVSGPDVAQLQRLLRDEGFLSGPADGVFGPITQAAVKRWQRSIDAPADGVVEPGSLLYVAGLPVRLAVVPSVGDRVTVGSGLVDVLGERPTFRALIGPSQRVEVVTGMTVSVTGPGGEMWQGSLGALEVEPDGRYSALLTGDLCGSRCGVIAVAGETVLSGSIELVPETSGIVVPTSALVLLPSGGASVELADGTTVVVRIVAEADGFAVVEGLAAGQRILLPGPP